MHPNDLLHFPGKNVKASRDDNVFAAIDDADVAHLVLDPDVAGIEPAVAEGRLTRFLVAFVARAQVCAAADDFALLADRQRDPSVVDDIHHHHRTATTDAAEALGAKRQ